MGNPKVSVIIPVYNTQPWLKECLDSVLRQTMDDFEVICVDDGSTDGSGFILREYAARDDRFAVIFQKNGGQSAARNAGLTIARGEYIYFLDSDDYIEPDLLEQACRELDDKDLDIVFFDTVVFGDPGIDQKEVDTRNKYYTMNGDYSEVSSGEDLLYRFLRNKDFSSSVCKQMVRRDYLGKHQLRFYEGIVNEDDLYTFQVTILARRAAYLHRILFHRRVRMNSTVTRPLDFRQPYGYFICVKEAYRFLLQRNYSAEQKKCFFPLLKKWISLARNQYKKLEETEQNRLEQLPEEDKFLFQACIKEYGDSLLYLKYSMLRVDIKNTGDKGCDVIEQSVIPAPVTVSKPGWMLNGITIESLSGKMKVTVKCVGNGELEIHLLGRDERDAERKRYPVWIDCTCFAVNGETVFNETKTVCHDKRYVFRKSVKDGEVICFDVAWSECRSNNVLDELHKLQSDLKQVRRKEASAEIALKKANAEKNKSRQEKAETVKKLGEARQRLKKTQKEAAKAKRELQNVKNGWSYKTGRVITWFPRKVRGGVRCWQEHGLVYTVKRFCEKMKIL